MSNNRNEFLESLRFDIAGIIDTYSMYSTGDYKNDLKQYALAEHLAILKAFPGLKFRTVCRIKSMDATLQKAKRKGIEHVYDIHGIKHIIISLDKKDDEQALIDACYRLEEFLETYSSSQNIGLVPNRRKDYIATPKESNYQAIHFSCKDKRNKKKI